MRRDIQRTVAVCFTVLVVASAWAYVVFFEVVPSLYDEGHCQGQGASTERCYAQRVLSLARTEGMLPAFQRLAQILTEDPAYVRTCHGLAHALGEVAYDTYAITSGFEVDAGMSLCGYGYYHGFIESMLRHGRTPLEAAHVCMDLSDDQERTRVTRAACFHGIGHGAADGTTVPGSTDPRDMVSGALTLCENVTDGKEEDLHRCATGVFHSLSDAYIEGQFDPTSPDGEFYALCDTFSNSILARACYEQLQSVAYTRAHKDLGKALAHTLPITDVSHRTAAIDSIAAYAARDVMRNTEGFHKTISTCQRTSPDVSSCIAGTAAGLVSWSAGGDDPRDALTLCAHGALTHNEQRICYQRVVWVLSGVRAQEDLEGVCGQIAVSLRPDRCYHTP